MNILKPKNEMDKTPSDARSLPTALAMKPKKRYANGGQIPPEAPSPRTEVPPVTIIPEKPAAPKAKLVPITKPKLAGSSVFSVRERDALPEAPKPLEAAKGPMPEAVEPEEAPQAPTITAPIDTGDDDEMEHASSIAAAIMQKRAKTKMMAEGGAVDDLDEQNLEALLKEGDAEPMEESDEINDADIVSAIRRRMKMKSAL